ncbi:MAG: NAD(P)H-dependent oxidoreductase [Solirubrobacterales bacterium]
MKVLGISGSLRRDSYNTRLLQVASRALPVDASLEVWSGLAELPNYNEDVDVPGGEPAAAGDLRLAIAEADTVLLVTPEYNGTISGAMKNAIDWASRPRSEAALKGKPVAVIGAGTGQYGGVWAQADARKAAGIAGARVVGIEFAVANAAQAFGEDGGLVDDHALPRLAELLEALVDEGRKNAAARGRTDAAAHGRTDATADGHTDAAAA